MLGLGNALRVYIERNVLFIYPARSTSEPEVLRGHVTITLRRSSRVELSVRLLGTATLDGQATVILDSRVQIDQELAAGVSTVEFALTVPQDSAPFEHSPYGKVRAASPMR